MATIKEIIDSQARCVSVDQLQEWLGKLPKHTHFLQHGYEFDSDGGVSIVLSFELEERANGRIVTTGE